MTANNKASFREAAALWNQAKFDNGNEQLLGFSVQEVTSNYIVYVTTHYENNTIDKAYTQGLDTPFLGHVDSFKISLNTNATYSSSELVFIFAHEIGHVFGLVDLDRYNIENELQYQFTNYMMGYGQTTFNWGPTASDIKGAAVITGLHKNSDHVFNSIQKYHIGNTNNVDYTYHRSVCGLCDGYKLVKHTFTHTKVDALYHKSVCSGCKHTFASMSHNYTYTYTSGSHTGSCSSCGYKKAADGHSFRLIKPGTNLYQCTVCDYQTTNPGQVIMGGATLTE